MVAIPSVISNKTVLTGLTQSALKSASVFKPAPAALDKMGHVAKISPSIGASKISAFKADIGASTSAIPAGLGRPFFVPKRVVSYR